MARRPLTDEERRLHQREVMIGAVLLVACVPAFTWVVLTRELSFAGSFGLLGGHWMLGVLMPIAVLSLVAIVHGTSRLWADSAPLPETETDADSGIDAWTDEETQVGDAHPFDTDGPSGQSGSAQQPRESHGRPPDEPR